jgi:hypothetical protein
VVASSVAAGGATVAVEKGVVWSGGRMAAAEAESLAAQVSAKTLQQTLGGRAIVQLERMGLNKSFAYHSLWKPASILYSSSMRSFGGLVHLGKGGAILEGIELPILRFRGLYR